MPGSPLTDEAIQLVAQRFKVLGEPLRLKLVHCLMEGEETVNVLVRRTGASQANVSRQLSLLTRSGVLKRRKQGLNAFYSIADSTVFRLCDLVCRSVESRLQEQIDAFQHSRPR